MTFEQELIITVVDKAVIGALIGIGAYWLNRRLERFKSSQALYNQFATQRVAAIATLWEAMHAWEADTLRMSYTLRKVVGGFVAESDIPSALQGYSDELIELRNREREIKNGIQRSQFWLGDELYARFLKHYQAILNHHGNIAGDNVASAVSDEAMQHLEEQLKGTRQSIFTYMAPGK